MVEEAGEMEEEEIMVVESIPQLTMGSAFPAKDCRLSNNKNLLDSDGFRHLIRLRIPVHRSQKIFRMTMRYVYEGTKIRTRGVDPVMYTWPMVYLLCEYFCCL